MLHYRVTWNYNYPCNNISKALLQKLNNGILKQEILKNEHNILISALYSDVINIFNQ